MALRIHKDPSSKSVAMLTLVFLASFVCITVGTLSAFFSDIINNESNFNTGCLQITPTLKINGETGDALNVPNTQSSASCIPAKYQTVEYLQFSGAQYINTGVDHTGNLKIVADYQYSALTTASSVFGAFADGSGAQQIALATNGATQYLIRYNSTANYIVADGLDTNRHVFRIEGSDGQKSFSFNGGTSTSITGSVPTVPVPIYLGARNSANNGAYGYFNGKVYSFSIDKDGTVDDRNLIPVRNRETGECLMWDTVSNVPFQNAGTGAITCPNPNEENCDDPLANGTVCNGQNQGNTGVIVVPNVVYNFSYTMANTGAVNYQNYTGDRVSAWLDYDYIPVEYVEFDDSSTQYIDTGIDGVGDTKVTLDFQLNATVNTSEYIFGSYGGGAWNSSNFSLMKLSSTDGGGVSVQNRFATRWGTTSTTETPNTSISFYPQLQDTNRHTWVQDNGTTIWDDTTLGTKTAAAPTASKNLYLGAVNTGAPVSSTFNGKVYSLNIEKNGRVVAHFIPVINAKTGECGFYDRVKGEFFSNNGTGTLTCLTVSPNTPVPIKVLLYPSSVSDSTIYSEIEDMQAGINTISPSAVGGLNGLDCSGTFYGTNDGIPACTSEVLSGTLNAQFAVDEVVDYGYKLVVYAPLGASPAYSNVRVRLGVSSGAQGVSANNWKQQVHPYVRATTPIGDFPVLEDSGENRTMFAGQITNNDKQSFLEKLVVAGDMQDGHCAFSGTQCITTVVSDGGFNPDVVGQYEISYSTTDRHGNTTTLVLTVEVVKIVHVATGMTNSAALDSSGRMFVFGNGGTYRLGNNNTAILTVPTFNTATEARFKYVDLIYVHGLGIDMDGHLWTWGQNSEGMLGYPADETTRRIPHEITGLSGNPKFIKVSGHFYSSFALDDTGNLWVFGDGANYGLGTGNQTDLYVPTKLTNFGSATPFITDFATGYTGDTSNAVLATDADGNIWAWGPSNYGSAGTGNTALLINPTKIYDSAAGRFLTNTGAINVGADTVAAGTKMVQVTVGEGTGYSRDENGSLYSWGSNIEYDMGTGSTTRNSSNSPQQFYDASTGNFLLLDNTPNPNASSPGVPRKMTSIMVNYATVQLIDIDGNLYSWGDGAYDQLGNNGTTPNDQTNPQKIYDVTTGQFVGSATLPAGTKIIQASTDGRGHALILAENGQVFATGNGAEYKLGTGNTTRALVATPWLFNPPAVSY